MMCNKILNKHNLFNGDIPAIVGLINSAMGDGFYSIRDVANFFIDDSVSVFALKDKEGIIAVMITSYIISENQKIIFEPVFSSGLSFPLGNAGRLQALVIKKEYRNRGIGKRLMLYAMNQLTTDGADFLVGTVWHHPDNLIVRVFKQLGFYSLGIIDKYWFNDSIEKGYKCPLCGYPCVCQADVYIKTKN